MEWPLKLRVSMFLCLLCAPIILWSQTVLIDPGHGGDDTGAKGKWWKTSSKEQKKSVTIMEKDLALQIATRIYYKLKGKKFNVYLTRSFDRTVPLQDRANMAEKLNADLYISVHINSSTNHASSGFEIYYLDNHSDVAVKKVEAAENNAAMQEVDPDIQHILTDLVVERTVESSKRLAQGVHESMKERMAEFKISARGVKPGLFYVLALAKRPSLLLEVGFMSNARELDKMMSIPFQEAYASSVMAGIERYFAAEKQLKNR